MTIPEQAVQAAQDAFNKTINDPIMVPCSRCSGKGYHHGFGEDGASPDWCIECGGSAFDVVPGEEERAMRAALTAAAPHLAAVRVNSDQIEAARKAVEELANTQMNLPLEDWSRISSAILSALEPSAARELALEEGDLQELLERLDAGLEYEGWMETDGAPVELFDIEAAQDLFTDAAAAIRALSSPEHADAGKVEGDGWLPTHRHKKRGTHYSLIGIGKMQADNWQVSREGFDQSIDMEEVSIYRSVDDGSLWVRPREEFEDGRFETLPTNPSGGDRHGE